MSLIELAEAGDTAGVLRELRALTLQERAARAEAVAARAEAIAASPDAYTDEQRLAQCVAHLGCHADPGTVAGWLMRNPLRPTTPGYHPSYDKYPDHALMVEITDLYPPGWRADLVARLAAMASAENSWRDWFPVAEHIIRTTGCPLPDTDGFLCAWLHDRGKPELHADRPPGGWLLARLRADDLAPKLLPLAVTRPGVPLGTNFFHHGNSWAGAFISLSAEGAVDRDTVIRRVFAEIASDPMEYFGRWHDFAAAVTALALTPEEHDRVSGERVWLLERLLKTIIEDWRGNQTEASLALLRALAPTAAENAPFAREYLTLIERRPGAAEYAQDVLLTLDEAGLLEAATFTEVSERVRNKPDTVAYRVAGFVSRLAVGNAIDRGALIPGAFAHLVRDSPYPGAAAPMVTGLALTPAEHARVAGDRVRLIEPILTRLLQEDGRQARADCLAFLRALAPTAAENASFLRDHVAMLDLTPTVAAYGQEALIGMDEAGLLDDDVRTEASERVLLRPEKKLVRAQLSWLDRAARADPARAAQVVADAAIAFRHGDMALRASARKVVDRHLPAAGDSVPPGLRDTVGRPLLEPSAQPEVLPVVPGPRPVPGPAQTPAEVAQEVAAVRARRHDVVSFERALDGLVRHARLDRAALAKALKPVLRRPPGYTGDCTQADLYDVAAAVIGQEPRSQDDQPAVTPAGAFLRARLTEAIEVIESGTQPFLLAVPTDATGALDAATLMARIAELDRLGISPVPVDLAQALLRVTPATDEATRRAAAELRCDAGQRLAHWLRHGGLPHQDTTPEGWPAADPASAPKGWWYPARPSDQRPSFPDAAADLAGPGNPGLDNHAAPFWVAQLPHHRDEVAARIQATHGRMLTSLAESGGPAGYAVHWHIARALGWDPDTGVDALLVLAARGQLDRRLFAGQSQALMRCGASTPSRVVRALRTAAETGAYATIWSVLEAALPALLRDKPIREAGAFLALAAECASKCGARARLAEVEAVAARGGSSQTVRNARVLRDILRGDVKTLRP